MQIHIFLLTLCICMLEGASPLDEKKKKVVKVPRKYRWAEQSSNTVSKFLSHRRSKCSRVFNWLVLVPLSHCCSHINLTANCQHREPYWISPAAIFYRPEKTGHIPHVGHILTSVRYIIQAWPTSAYAAIHERLPTLEMKYGLRLYMFKHTRRRHKKHTHTHTLSYKRLDASVPLGIFNITENRRAQHFKDVVVN